VNHQLSQAALETVAIIDYKQPVSRGGIEDISGVKSEKALQTLIGRGLVEEVGRQEGTGRAILYGITPMFYHFFGLESLDELPEMTLEASERIDEEESDLFYEKFQQTLSDLP
jgi:segregation and condensation protein B